MKILKALYHELVTNKIIPEIKKITIMTSQGRNRFDW